MNTIAVSFLILVLPLDRLSWTQESEPLSIPRSLTNLRWDISLSDAKRILFAFSPEADVPKYSEGMREEMKKNGVTPQLDTVLTYFDELMGNRGKVELRFSSRLDSLKQITVSFDSLDIQFVKNVSDSLTRRYGEPVASRTKKKTVLLFFTFASEMKFWKTKTGGLVLNVFARGDTPLSLSLMYSPSSRPPH